MKNRAITALISALIALTTVALNAAAAAAAATAPAASTGPTGTITETTAVLQGTVTPNGSSTTYYFQWGPTPAYGTNSAVHSAGHGTSAVVVHTTAGGLRPGSVYHYRVVAVNSLGTTGGADSTFTTVAPPAVSSGPAVQLGSTHATVTGQVNPLGAAVSWSFQFGVSSSYGVETFSRSLPAAGSPLPVSATLRGLAPGTVFHYRLIARHTSSGSLVGYGSDERFMTYPAHRPVPAVPARTVVRRPAPNRHLVTVSGRVRRPSWIPAEFACSGRIRVNALAGGRVVRSLTAAVERDCSYRAELAFRSGPGAELRLVIRFLGNHYLAPASARPVTARIR